MLPEEETREGATKMVKTDESTGQAKAKRDKEKGSAEKSVYVGTAQRNEESAASCGQTRGRAYTSAQLTSSLLRYCEVPRHPPTHSLHNKRPYHHIHYDIDTNTA